jgi:hypothetical protein
VHKKTRGLDVAKELNFLLLFFESLFLEVLCFVVAEEE